MRIPHIIFEVLDVGLLQIIGPIHAGGTDRDFVVLLYRLIKWATVKGSWNKICVIIPQKV